MGRPTFNALREKIGNEGISAALEGRVDVVDGDFSAAELEIPGGLDVVIHCAATVAFDPPIDEGFLTNLVGAVRLYEAALANNPSPHLLHVSTAYVAGVRKGVIPEATLDHRVDWRAESDLAIRARADVEAASRKPEILDSFLRRARSEHGRAGPQSVADDAEERRKTWVTKRLVQYGRARAQTLGWPDNYTFTKAMGERAVEELAASHGVPLSIVRPSIIESSYEHPFPGWIEGFKMAEPIILAYGRGTIPDFPGIPEGIIDIIPADFVVNAMLAAAANPPEPASPAYYHVSSGSRNPLAVQGSVREREGVLRARSAPAAGARHRQGPRVDVPRQPPRRTPPADRRTRRRRGRQGRHPPAQVQAHARPRHARRPRQGSRGLRAPVLGPVRGVHRGRGDLHRRPDDRAVGLAHPGRSRAFPVRRRGGRLAVLPPGRALPRRHVGAPSALGQARETAGPDPRARTAGPRAVRHGGDDPALERRRVLRLVADGRPAVGSVARRARERVLADPVVPDGRPARPRRVPPDVLPALRGRDGRGHRASRRGDRVRVHAPEGLGGRGPADPGPPRRRAPHDDDHGGGRAVRAAARAAVRRGDRGAARGPRRRVHGLPGRTAPGGRGARGLDPPVRRARGGRPSSPRTPTRTRTRISRCCGRSATRLWCRPTRRCCGWPSAGAGRSRTGGWPGACPGCGSPSRRCADGVGSFRDACVPRATAPLPPGLPGPHP